MLDTSQQIIFTAAYNAQVTKNCGSVCLLKMTALVILVKFFTATALWTALKIALIWQQSAKRTTFPWKPIFLLVQWEKLFDSESLEIPWWWFHDVCQTVRRDPGQICSFDRQTVDYKSVKFYLFSSSKALIKPLQGDAPKYSKLAPLTS